MLTQDDRWKVFGFYAYGARVDANCRRCPRTTEIIESIPDMTTAMFSVLLPHKHIPPHVGPWKGVLRYHLAVRTPADETAARIRVGSRIEHWHEGRSLVFGDTYEHDSDDSGEERNHGGDQQRGVEPVDELLRRQGRPHRSGDVGGEDRAHQRDAE